MNENAEGIGGGENKKKIEHLPTSTLAEKDEVHAEGHEDRRMVTNEDLRLIEKLAPEFGITVTTLAKEGEPYQRRYLDALSTAKLEKGEIKKGESYIRLDNPREPEWMDGLENAIKAVKSIKTGIVEEIASPKKAPMETWNFKPKDIKATNPTPTKP